MKNLFASLCKIEADPITTTCNKLNVLLYTASPFVKIREKYSRDTYNPDDIEKNQKKTQTLKNLQKYISEPQKIIDIYFHDIAKTLISDNHHFPAFIKYALIGQVMNFFSPKIFVETGTLWGDTCLFFRNHFKKLYTIDIDKFCYENAKNISRNFPNIEPILGDSGIKITEVLEKIDEPALFFLDGHFTPIDNPRGKNPKASNYGNLRSEQFGNTPIISEIKKIGNHIIKNHVILIDDVGHFEQNEAFGYPSMTQLIEYCKQALPNHEIMVRYGMFIIFPKNSKDDFLKYITT